MLRPAKSIMPAVQGLEEGCMKCKGCIIFGNYFRKYQ